MTYHLGVEDIEPNHWVAFVFEHPACFSSAATLDEAVANAPVRIAEYLKWLAGFVDAKSAPNQRIEVQVAQVFHSHPSASDLDYVVNALFDDDVKPLTRADVHAGLIILSYARHDLNALVEKISAAQLTQPLVNDSKNSIAKILDHVAWAEWWYFNRLDLGFPRSAMPRDTLAKLEKVRAQTRALLPNLVGDVRVTEKAGEKWSARKVLRRTLWHERDHTKQIERIVGL